MLNSPIYSLSLYKFNYSINNRKENKTVEYLLLNHD